VNSVLLNLWSATPLIHLSDVVGLTLSWLLHWGQGYNGQWQGTDPLCLAYSVMGETNSDLNGLQTDVGKGKETSNWETCVNRTWLRLGAGKIPPKELQLLGHWRVAGKWEVGRCMGGDGPCGRNFQTQVQHRQISLPSQPVIFKCQCKMKMWGSLFQTMQNSGILCMQSSYCLSTPPVHFALVILEMGVLKTVYPG
jgi:hypothetical protein